MSENLLDARGLAVGYPPRPPVLTSVDVALGAGELVCLLGPNGSGKSTLLRALAGLGPTLAGTVRLGGDDLEALPARERARRLGVVLPERAAVGLLTVAELVALGRHPYTPWSGRLSPRDRAVVERVLEQVGAAELAARPVADLSDGERQKTMIARALAQEPRVLILDEPTAFLDLPGRVEILALLRALAHDDARAVLLSTHDLDLALRSADRVWLIDRGALVAGAPEDLVLDGTLERVFARRGVDFDVTSGAFRPHREGTWPVHVSGEGTAALWARRALERTGCRVVPDGDAGAVARVEVVAGDDGPRFVVEVGGERVRHASVAALVEDLQRRLAAARNATTEPTTLR